MIDYFDMDQAAKELYDEAWIDAAVEIEETARAGRRVMTTAFETGKTYWTRSIGVYDCIIRITVQKRTAKTIWAEAQGRLKAMRVKVIDDVETVNPWGVYSMSPIVKASRPHDPGDP